MCGICNVTSIPACNLVGGCSVQTLDFIKMIAMSGGAGLGLFATVLQTKVPKGKHNDKK